MVNKWMNMVEAQITVELEVFLICWKRLERGTNKNFFPCSNQKLKDWLEPNYDDLPSLFSDVTIVVEIRLLWLILDGIEIWKGKKFTLYICGCFPWPNTLNAQSINKMDSLFKFFSPHNASVLQIYDPRFITQTLIYTYFWPMFISEGPKMQLIYEACVGIK